MNIYVSEKEKDYYITYGNRYEALELNKREPINIISLEQHEAEIKKPLEDEIERLKSKNNSLMLELRATRYKFLEFQDLYVKQVADIISAQPSVLKFEDAKGLHNILRKQERQSVIAELEEWALKEKYSGWTTLDKLKQKLKEMKEV